MSPRSSTKTAVMAKLSISRDVKGCENFMDALLRSKEETPFACYKHLLDVYAESGEHEKAVKLFTMMQNSGRATSPTYTTMMNMWAKRGCFENCEQLFEGLLRTGPGPSVGNCNALLWMFVRKRDVGSAMKLMSRMESGNLPAPHAGCMSAMLTLYSTARNADKVKELSSKIVAREDCKEPEYHSVLRALCQLGLVDEAEKIMKVVEEEGKYLQPRLYLKLLNGYTNIRNREGVQNVIVRMKARGFGLSTSFYNGVLSAYFSMEDNDEAEKLWNDPRFEKDESSYKTILRHYIKQKKHRRACDIALEMKRRKVGGPLSMYPALVQAAAKEGLLDEARQLILEMRRADEKPTAELYSSVIESAAIRGYQETVRDLLHEMTEMGLEPVLGTHLAILSSCGTTGDLATLKRTFDHLRERGLHTNNLVVTKMLHALRRNGQDQWAVNLFSELVAEGLRPDAIVFEQLIPASVQLNDLKLVTDHVQMAVSAKVPLSIRAVKSSSEFAAANSDEDLLTTVLGNASAQVRKFVVGVCRMKAYSILAGRATAAEDRDRCQQEIVETYAWVMERLEHASERDAAYLMDVMPDEAEEIYGALKKPVGLEGRSGLVRALCRSDRLESMEKARELVLDAMSNRVYLALDVLNLFLRRSINVQGLNSDLAFSVFRELVEKKPSPFTSLILRHGGNVYVNCQGSASTHLVGLSLMYISRTYPVGSGAGEVFISMGVGNAVELVRALNEMKIEHTQTADCLVVSRRAVASWNNGHSSVKAPSSI
eukprot:CAMPEP_0184743960 /NCGR_PEP_ID=MMETSP0315-20130426/6753_1 /TAXON_ID=101924 /ORGANISM="Rhodosorus marinus, Strain UTEX LB 2760" /LENGTH=768 /DNA_ID=CAMNT_0027215445 /DNA_START=371 /DNA_END=2677 /DNA_ORIENTATION=+